MEWRCEWCGKPHESDDPPCDNCGHGSFERAIVRMPGSDSGAETTTVWVCTDCGREHPKNSPPCSRCTNATLEKREKRVDESNLTERPGTGSAGKLEAETTTVWVCTDCGREHPKHSPPCSRCGNATLEQETKRVDESELEVPGYLDVLTPGYALAMLVILVVASLFTLGVTGLVDIPGFGSDVPDVEDVPGNESETNGLDHAELEQAYLDAFNAEREANGLDAVERNDWLDDVATFLNQRNVKQLYADGAPVAEETRVDLYEEECSEAFTTYGGSLTDFGTDEGELAELFVDELGEDAFDVLDGMEQTGIDVHTVDGTLYLTQSLCT